MKITAPNYTQTPNDLFDHWLPLLKESELKVLLVIMRKTFGWHKVRDRISIRQLATLTGLAQETVIIATKSLQKKGVILKHVIGKPGLQETYYELVVSEDSNNSYPSEKQRGKDGVPLGFTPLGESEPQKKPSSSKEKTTTKERQSAAVSSEKEQSKKRKQIHECLEELDIPERDKIEISKKHDEETVKHAIAFCQSPQVKINKGLAPAIKWACVNKPEIPKAEKKTPFEMIKKIFKNGELYNSAVCDIDEKSISFTRGMKFETIKFDSFFSWRRFQILCESFGIKIEKPSDV